MRYDHTGQAVPPGRPDAERYIVDFDSVDRSGVTGDFDELWCRDCDTPIEGGYAGLVPVDEQGIDH